MDTAIEVFVILGVISGVIISASLAIVEWKECQQKRRVVLGSLVALGIALYIMFVFWLLMFRAPEVARDYFVRQSEFYRGIEKTSAADKLFAHIPRARAEGQRAIALIMIGLPVALVVIVKFSPGEGDS